MAASEYKGEEYPITCISDFETYRVVSTTKPTHCPGCGRLLEGER